MDADDVIGVLERLDGAGIECWIDGGWGVDALLGTQTRRHGDLDLGVRLPDVPRIETLLSEFRRIETGEWPRFLILADESRRRLDLAITANVGRQELAHGRIGDREVRCVTLEVQLDHARAADVAALGNGVARASVRMDLTRGTPTRSPSRRDCAPGRSG